MASNTTWRREFLPTLNVHKQWFEPHRNFESGDIVILAEPKTDGSGR